MKKLLLLTKTIREANRQRSVTIHPNQLEVAGLKVGDEVNVYVSGKKKLSLKRKRCNMKEYNCCSCNSDILLEGYLFKHKGKVYCLDCLEEFLYELDTAKTKEYYLGGEYVGNDDNIEQVIKAIKDNTEVEVIEEG